MLSIRKLTQLVELCAKISERTKADAFFRYSPHVGGFEVDVYYKGWEAHRYPDVCMSYNSYIRKCEIRYPQGGWVTEYASMNEVVDCLAGLLEAGMKKKGAVMA